MAPTCMCKPWPERAHYVKVDGFCSVAVATNEHLFLDYLICVTMCISHKSFDLINHSTHLARSSPAPGTPWLPSSNNTAVEEA